MNLEPLPVIPSTPAKWWEMVRTGMLTKVTFGLLLVIGAWLWAHQLSKESRFEAAEPAPAEPAARPATGVMVIARANPNGEELLRAANSKPASETAGLNRPSIARRTTTPVSHVTHTVIALLDDSLPRLQAGDEVELRSADGKTVIGYAQITRIAPSEGPAALPSTPGAARSLQVVVQVKADVPLRDRQTVYMQSKRGASRRL